MSDNVEIKEDIKKTVPVEEKVAEKTLSPPVRVKESVVKTIPKQIPSDDKKVGGRTRINDIPTKGKVVIKVVSVNGKPAVLPNTKRRPGPFMDMDGRVITGTFREEWEAWSIILDIKIDKEYWRDFFFTLTSAGRELDLSVPMHRLYYAFIKSHYEVANSIDDVDHRSSFYIKDEIAEASESDKVFELEMRGLNLLMEMSSSEREKFSLLYGLKPYNVDPQVLKQRMVEKIKSNPKHFLKLYNSPDKSNNILLGELVEKSVIQLRNGAYYEGESIIGADRDKTIAYLKDPMNNEKVIALKQILQVKRENQM